MLPSLLRIAMRNVLRNRRRSVITFSAVFLALGVMVGIRGFPKRDAGHAARVDHLGSDRCSAGPSQGFLKAVATSSLELTVPTDEAFLAKIRAVPGVKAVTTRIAFGGMVNANDTSAVAMLSAIDPQHEVEVCPRRLDMISPGQDAGRWRNERRHPDARAGQQPGVGLGKTATILTNDRDGVMNALDVSYVGVYGQPGLPMPDKKFGFVPIALAQELCACRTWRRRSRCGSTTLRRPRP